MPQLQQYDFSPGVDRCAWRLLLSVTAGAAPAGAVTVLFNDAMRVCISTLCAALACSVVLVSSEIRSLMVELVVDTVVESSHCGCV